jgi:septal ring factor EnvC (AmiA/AmiB activator)
MKSYKWILSAFSLLLVVSSISFAQNSKDLKRKRSKTLQQIAVTKRILRETKGKKRESLSTLQALQGLIDTREQYITDLSSDLVLLQKEIESGKTDLASAEEKIETEKKRLAKLLFTLYKTKNSYNRIAFVLSSENFNQAMRRVDYLKQIAHHQNKFVLDIEDRKREIQYTIEVLNATKLEKDSVLISQNQEQDSLLSNKTEKQELVKILQGKEDDLRKQLKQQQRAAANLNNAIKKAIAREMEAIRKKKEAERKRKERERKKREAEKKKNKEKVDEQKKEELESTPEDKVLSNSFLSNRGKLPWPVTKGFISEKFGRHDHESLSGIVVENNGVDITTTKGASVRAIFKGEVSAIIEIPGMGKTVLISHGDYFTVYSKLATVSVSKGDKITLKQNVGTVMTDDSGKNAVHLEIWQKQQKQNPELWLMKR